MWVRVFLRSGCDSFRFEEKTFEIVRKFGDKGLL